MKSAELLVENNSHSAPLLPSAPEQDELLLSYDEAVENDLPPSYEDATALWYQNLSQEQQYQLNQQYLLLCQNQAAMAELQQRNLLQASALRRMQYQQTQSVVYVDTTYYQHDFTAIDYYNMYMMSRMANQLVAFNLQLDYQIIQSAIQVGGALGHEISHLAKVAAPIIGKGAAVIGQDLVTAAAFVGHEASVAGHAVANGVSHAASSISHTFSSSSSDSNSDSGKLILGIIALAAAAVAAAVACMGAIYSSIKAFKSLRNILHAEKIAKSLLRLSAIGGGATIGTMKGIVIGGLVGSSLPVIGTTIGAVLGGIIGGGFTAAGGAFAAKYIGKGLTALAAYCGVFGKKGTSISPSNPGKYQLSKKQKLHMQEHGATDTARIHNMMRAIKTQKAALGFNASIPGTTEYNRKQELNELLKKGIKKSPQVVNEGSYSTSNHNRLFWHDNTKKWLSNEPVAARALRMA